MVRRAVTAGLAAAAVGALALAALPAALGGRTVVALQGSMAPALPTGAAIVLVPVGPEALRPDDIVAFVPPGKAGLVTHRVVAIEDGTLVTKGDANPMPDVWRIPLRAGTLRVALVVPAIGYPLAVLGRPGVGLALIGVAIAVAWRARRGPERG